MQELQHVSTPQPAAAPAEPVRLVVWDLDETLWHGTLSEGGIRLRPEVHAMVIELAQRGIVSSICSKNDEAPVRAILEREGLWTYFVFPSIDWTAKGPRLKELAEAIQLRPASILLIDDNAMNLAEAAHYVPGLQTASDAIIPGLLADRRLKGKDDTGLTRLAQYRLLQQRHAGIRVADGDTAAFLRDSNIRVAIEHDLEPHLDRIVELVNRTNQLNFCKDRLPEDPEAAREALRARLAPHQVQAGLLRVQDRYGDYGFCGFYLLYKQHTNHPRLQQFCFSCRILNMGIEAWLYRALGRPTLKVEGEVAADPVGDTRDIDWIQREQPGRLTGGPALPKFDHVVLRGGCDLQPLAHYLASVTPNLVGELHVTRGGQVPVLSHSIMIRHALQGISPEAGKAAEPFGFVGDDFASFIARAPHTDRGLWVFSFAHDNWASLYRYRPTGELIPINLSRVPGPTRNLLDRQISPDQAAPELIAHLRAWFEFCGPVTAPMFLDSLRMLLDSAPPHVRLVFLLGNEWLAAPSGEPAPAPGMIARNRLVQEAASGRGNVDVLRITDYVPPGSAPVLGHHFDRIIHYRLFEDILRHAARTADPAVTSSVKPA